MNYDVCSVCAQTKDGDPTKAAPSEASGGNAPAEQGTKDTATMSMDEKVDEVVAKAKEFMGVEVSRDKALELLTVSDGVVDIAISLLMG